MTVINVAVIGVGLVGKEFLSQLASYASRALNASQKKQIKLVYVSSSKKAAYDTEDGIPLDNWAKVLDESSSGPTPSELSARLKSDLDARAKSTGNEKEVRVVVDNTSSDEIASLYPTFLRNGFNVITPNKKAFSSSLQLYDEIIKASGEQGGGRYFGESTVGAGLPVVQTLKDLVETGDEVRFVTKDVSRANKGTDHVTRW